MGAILIILVAVDASALVCYITRFTEENFATLIAFIFIYKVGFSLFFLLTFSFNKFGGECSFIASNFSNHFKINLLYFIDIISDTMPVTFRVEII